MLKLNRKQFESLTLNKESSGEEKLVELLKEELTVQEIHFDKEAIRDSIKNIRSAFKFREDKPIALLLLTVYEEGFDLSRIWSDKDLTEILRSEGWPEEVRAMEACKKILSANEK